MVAPFVASLLLVAMPGAPSSFFVEFQGVRAPKGLGDANTPGTRH